MKFINSKDNKVTTFFQSKLHKEIWNIKTKYFINKTMQVELNNFEYVLSNPNKVT